MEAVSPQPSLLERADDVIANFVQSPIGHRVVTLRYYFTGKNIAYLFAVPSNVHDMANELQNIKAACTGLADTEFRVISNLRVEMDCDGIVSLFIGEVDQFPFRRFGSMPQVTELVEAIDYHNSGFDIESPQYLRVVHYTERKRQSKCQNSSIKTSGVLGKVSDIS